jgi:predicted permease
MGTFTSRLRQVLRRLGRAPLFTIVTIITLAVGIGANAVIFGVLNGVLLKPLPYSKPNELVGVWLNAPGINLPVLNFSPSTYLIVREQGESFQDIALYTGDAATVTGSGEPEHVDGLDVTDGMLGILGTKPALGRGFARADDEPGAPETVMITYGYWTNKFGSDPNVIGRSITMDGTPRQIIGVLPKDFRFLDYHDAQFMIPFHFDRAKLKLGNYSFNGIARLKPGVTLTKANADLARLLPVVIRSFPLPDGFSMQLFNSARIGPDVHPLKQDVVGDVGSVLWLLMASIGGVLLIACANVANLLLVRVEGRRQELAVRSALGAGWRQIASDLLFESATLGAIGSVFGLVIAYAGLRLLVSMAPDGLPRINEIGIDGQVLLFVFGISILVSLLCAVIPIFKYARAHVTTGLREGGRAMSGSREQHRARSVLVIAQVALALVLLICSGLMIRTFRALTQVNPGFTDPKTIASFRISIPEAIVAKDKDDELLRFEEQILQKIQAIPGVQSAAFSSKVPLDGNGANDPVFAEDKTYQDGADMPLTRFIFMTPGYLQTIGTPLIAGRDYTWDDLYNKKPVAMVSENLAKKNWGSAEAAIGKRVRVASVDDWREVVGVVGDIHQDGMNKDAPRTAFWPILMSKFEGQPMRSERYVGYVIRSPRAGSEAFMSEVRQAVWSVNANLPLSNVHTVEFYYQSAMARTSFTLIMLVVAGAMALMLGVVGIYGVIAYSVSQRKREIGIRMALGAQRETVSGMFVRDGLILTGIGVACGLIGAAIAMRLMASVLFHVKPVDPVTYVGMSIGVVAVAFVASYLPARRASSVDPIETLRGE